MAAEPAAPPATDPVVRFDRTERLVHWVHAATFLTLLGSGLILGTNSLEALVGRRALLHEIHLVAAFFFVFGPAAVALAGNRGAIGQDTHDIDRWSGDDFHWLSHPDFQPDRWSHPQGRFNAGQKLNAIFTVYAIFAFALTGLIMWQNRRFPFTVVEQANTIHTALAYLALLVFLGHLYLAVIHPATRQALHGMVFGTVRRSWARSHHPLGSLRPPPAPLSVGALVRSGLITLGTLEAALLLIRTLFEWLGANPTDPVTQLYYAWSAAPGTLRQHHTGHHAFDLAALLWAGLLASALIAFTRGEALLPTLWSPRR